MNADDFTCCFLQVMDYNIGLGKQLLPLVVQVLKYCTCPQLRHYFQQPPRCSLWALRPHIRQMWLKALLVILYKVLFVSLCVSGISWHGSLIPPPRKMFFHLLVNPESCCYIFSFKCMIYRMNYKDDNIA